MQCSNGGENWELIERRNLIFHETQEWLYRVVPWKLRCGDLLRFNEMDEHISTVWSKEIVKCKNKCGKLLERGLLEKHLRKNWPLEVIDWPNHGNTVFEEGWNVRDRRWEMDEHTKTWEFRKLMWNHGNCGNWIMFKDLEKHDLVWQFKVVSWKNQCGAEYERFELEQHYQVCKLEVIKWTYYEFGCDVEVMRKDYK